MSEDVLVHLADMRPSQLARRDRALDSVVALVSERGVENVGMKDVAQHSGVALGTLYRFFASKDHLFAAAHLHWQKEDSTRQPGLSRGRDERSANDRVKSVMRHGIRAFQARPNMLGLLVSATASTDTFASETMQESRGMSHAVFLEILGDSTDAPVLARALEACWMDSLTSWYTGRTTAILAGAELDTIVDTLLADRLERPGDLRRGAAPRRRP